MDIIFDLINDNILNIINDYMVIQNHLNFHLNIQDIIQLLMI